MFRHSAMTFSQQFKYRAFISYSHAADGKLAPALQSALHRFAKPWYRLRAMRVFRDKTSLAMTPELWPSIKRALGESEYFLLHARLQAKSHKHAAMRQRRTKGRLRSPPVYLDSASGRAQGTSLQRLQRRSTAHLRLIFPHLAGRLQQLV